LPLIRLKSIIKQMLLMRLIALFVVCLMPAWLRSQQSASATDLARVSQELQETRSSLAAALQQIQELRRDLDEVRAQVKAAPAAESNSTEPTLADADQDPSFLAAKIAELHQDKVESASKYQVKISGLVLFNSYVNAGSMTAADVPILAVPRSPGSPNGSIGATLSQTVLGIDVKGPQVFGAKAAADVGVDFSGGSPTTQYGVTAGLVRLRTANARLRWSDTTLTIGQDTPFFSPLSPTSYASVAQPAFSWAGNLWVWTPQAVLEHRITAGVDSVVTLQAGMLDPLTEEIPSFQDRSPTSGEVTRVPAIAGRFAFDHHSATHPLAIGVAAYRARHRYELFPEIDSWTVNTDFKAGITQFLEVSGEGYKGQAVGGLGGGIWSSVIFPEPLPPHSVAHPLRSVGGWAQLKLKPISTFEINSAIGQDENYAASLRFFPVPFGVNGFPAFQKNQAQFVNFVYTPKTSLVLAMEYRHLRTTFAGGQSASGDQVNLAAGVHF